jgi:enoyl-CoA hydratase/carnithine racemase
MDGVFWGTMGDTLAALEADTGIHGVVFSSGLQRDVFTAGNDITELYMPVRACICVPIPSPSCRQKSLPDPLRHA